MDTHSQTYARTAMNTVSLHPPDQSPTDLHVMGLREVGLFVWE